MSTITNSSLHNFKVVMLDAECRYTNWTRDVTASNLAWDFVRFDSKDSLLLCLDEQICDAVIIPCSMRAQVDIELMAQIAKRHPTSVRVFMGAEYWNAAQKAKAADVAHRIYPSAVTIEDLGASLEYQIKLLHLLNRSSLQAYVGSVGCLPSPPSIYRQLTDAINSDRADLADIGEIVEQDPAVVAQIMKQVNSAFFGFERTIVDLKEAISMLGVRNLRSLALSSQLNNQFKSPDDWKAFSFEQMNARSLVVARLAQTICRRAGASKVMQDQAFLAGLLHDLGILIMASHNPEQYKKLLNYAVKKSKPIYLVEKAAFGFFHGEVAGALLALWNLPPQVIEAVMLHHVPHLSKDHDFKVLTAVHVADAMIPSVHVEGECNLASNLSLRYLDQVGVMDEVPQWRIVANEYRVRMVSNL
ncbi:HDOD domain-containing protein [Neptuniibacter sp. 1_MG-2023]|jgi:HD-like signal output (HDOD) protein|uniref:HDOD domain-containing protein n=1 Tax=Neptuniibacter sp. 1_MG-2023 TaxID=3062662 RepID=UPI0026E21347|nr:HDOD domain-containing protein [Neptuniibacter sp. 1_MG-2023]MDO6592542.1 HDOD domain-containing protein [Neptuniibacter sp. 1_MG-2023]